MNDPNQQFSCMRPPTAPADANFGRYNTATPTAMPTGPTYSPNGGYPTAYGLSDPYAETKTSVLGGSGINDLPRIHPGDHLSFGDAVNYTGNLANSYWQNFGPLQSAVAKMYQGVFNGQAPEQLHTILAPQYAQILQAVRAAQGQIQNTTHGGLTQQGLVDAANSAIQARANAFTQAYAPIFAGATETGSNVASRAMAPFISLAQARNQRKALMIQQAAS